MSASIFEHVQCAVPFAKQCGGKRDDLSSSDNSPAARLSHFLLWTLGSDCLQTVSATFWLYLGIAPSLASPSIQRGNAILNVLYSPRAAALIIHPFYKHSCLRLGSEPGLEIEWWKMALALNEFTV